MIYLALNPERLMMFEYQKFLKDEGGLTMIEYLAFLSATVGGLYIPLSYAYAEWSVASDALSGAFSFV
jgi:Flp pilus assembly pilin Flp